MTTLVQKICPHCLQPYTLGVDGVEEGCDTCMNIVRNPLDNTFIEETADVSWLTIDEPAKSKRGMYL